MRDLLSTVMLALFKPCLERIRMDIRNSSSPSGEDMEKGDALRDRLAAYIRQEGAVSTTQWQGTICRTTFLWNKRGNRVLARLYPLGVVPPQTVVFESLSDK